MKLLSVKEVEVTQWNGDNEKKVYNWLRFNECYEYTAFIKNSDGSLNFEHEGLGDGVYAEKGDWLILDNDVVTAMSDADFQKEYMQVKIINNVLTMNNAVIR